MAQLEDYLKYSNTQFGLFAADTDPSKWTFWKKRGNEIDEITCSQFETGITRKQEIQSVPELEIKIEELTQTESDRRNICKELQVKINRLDIQKSGLGAELTRLGGKIQSLKSREVDLEAKVESFKGNERELNVSVESQHAQLDGLKTEIETLTQTECNMQASNKKLEVETNQLNNRKSKLEIEVKQLNNLKSKLHRWQFIIPVGIVGLILIFSFGVLSLIERNEKDNVLDRNAKLTNQLTQKESEIRRKDSETQGLTLSVQTLKSENETLSQKISELENRRRNRTLPTDTTSKSIAGLQGQLSEQKDKNQRLQNQLVKKDTEVRQLRNDKAVAMSENRRLQSRLAEDRPDTTNQNATVRQLPSENLKLQNRNQDLVRQNQELQSENKALQNQLDNAKQSESDQVNKSPSGPNDGQQPAVPPQMENLVAEPPEKIKVINRAGSHNNQGCFAFEGGDYDKAINQFEQAIKADSQFAVAHYNLGCAYLETKTYKKAVDAFDETVVLDQNFKEAYYNLGIAWFRMNIFQSAKQAVEKALSIDPNYQLAQELLTEIENAQQ